MARLKPTSDKFVARSKKVSTSTKRSKPAKPVFGTSSQFKGVGRGVRGDVRK